MMVTDPERLPWEQLSQSARWALVEVVRLLSNRFTGEIRLECSEGGVRNLREARSRRPGKIENLAQDEPDAGD